MSEPSEIPFKLTVSVDFDGVIHSYTSPWVHPTVIPDPPVPGAIAWLEAATDRLHVAVNSVRNQSEGGPEAMTAWLLLHGMNPEKTNLLRFPLHKPKAAIYIDDRGWQFTGTFPTIEEIEAFKPWNRR